MTGFPAWRTAFFGVSLLAACTDPGFTGVAGMREAEANQVAACRYVSNLRMSPGVYGPLADEGLRYTRNKIMADARSMGANTVVFDKVTPGLPVGEVTAVAYTC